MLPRVFVAISSAWRLAHGVSESRMLHPVSVQENCQDDWRMLLDDKWRFSEETQRTRKEVNRWQAQTGDVRGQWPWTRVKLTWGRPRKFPESFAIAGIAAERLQATRGEAGIRFIRRIQVRAQEARGSFLRWLSGGAKFLHVFTVHARGVDCFKMWHSVITFQTGACFNRDDMPVSQYSSLDSLYINLQVESVGIHRV